MHEVLDAYTRFWTHTRGSGRIHGVLDAYMEFLNCWLTTSRVDAFIRKLTHRRNCRWRYSWRRDELNCRGEHYGMLLCCLNAILLVEHYSVGWICGPFWCLIWKSTHVRVSERIEKTVVDDILLRCRCEHHWMSLGWWNPPLALMLDLKMWRIYELLNTWRKLSLTGWPCTKPSTIYKVFGAVDEIWSPRRYFDLQLMKRKPVDYMWSSCRFTKPLKIPDAVDGLQSHWKYTKPLMIYEALDPLKRTNGSSGCHVSITNLIEGRLPQS